MDISDGLFCDSNKMLEMNGYGFTLVDEISDEVGLSGEEYEMLVSFAPQHAKQVLEISKQTNTPLTIFAKISKNSKVFKCKSHHFED